ncbi:MAG: Rossmann-like and DUF2520 domain-containing protein [Anaerovoracaceae bacterium]
MKAGFIGAGKAGSSLGRHFVKNGISVSGYFSRSDDSSKEAADSTGSTAFFDFTELVNESDIIFLTTPDGIISEMAVQLAHAENGVPEDKILCHLSGSVPSSVLSCAGSHCASAHPMTAVSSRRSCLDGVFFTLEGETDAVTAVEKLLRRCGNPTARIRSDKKGVYHCAASVASNLMVGLAGIALDLLADCGFERESALQLLTPLMTGNIAAVCERGPAAALTGPVERGDLETVRLHLDSLSGDRREIYRLLSRELVRLAGEKHNTNEDRALLALLEEKK